MMLELMPIEIRRALRVREQRQRRSRLGASLLVLGALGIFVLNLWR